MDYAGFLPGREDPLPVFVRIVQALEDFEEFPFLLEPIYREASELDDDDLDRLRFGLVRLQVYADIHRYEDMETAQQMKYVACRARTDTLRQAPPRGRRSGRQAAVLLARTPAKISATYFSAPVKDFLRQPGRRGRALRGAQSLSFFHPGAWFLVPAAALHTNRVSSQCTPDYVCANGVSPAP
jgi:hypothetical protein